MKDKTNSYFGAELTPADLENLAGGGRLSPKKEVLCPKCGELMEARKSWYEGAVGYTKIVFFCRDCRIDKTLTNRDVQ